MDLGAIQSRIREERETGDTPANRRLGRNKILKWRRAMERASRMHARFRSMPPGKSRDKLARKLGAFTAEREHLAAKMTAALVRHGAPAADFEVMAGTVGLVTDPKSAAKSHAVSPGMGFAWVPLFWVVAIAGSVSGIWALSSELGDTIADSITTSVQFGMLVGVAWIGYRVFFAETKRAPAHYGGV